MSERRSLCVVPLARDSRGDVRTLVDSSTRRVLYHCGQSDSFDDVSSALSLGSRLFPSGSQAVFEFPGASYDALAVVEAPGIAALLTCFSNGNGYSCPVYSYSEILRASGEPSTSPSGRP